MGSKVLYISATTFSGKILDYVNMLTLITIMPSDVRFDIPLYGSVPRVILM